MLSTEEILKIQTAWTQDQQRYGNFSDYVRDRCFAYRQENPTVARIIFSREPKVKTVSSVIQKIELRRQDTPTFSYKDLVDIVALTILCPYESDISQFIVWMKTAFEVLTPDSEATKNYPSGHRGRHYIIEAKIGELVNFPAFNGLKCELQVKSILEEAFDAKSHDLAYKPGHYEVGTDLKNQFSILASLLKAIDSQSEFLKDLIVKEQQEMELRRSAIIRLYFAQDEMEKIGKSLNIDLTNSANLPPVGKVAEALRKGAEALLTEKKDLSREFCKFAALCALNLKNDLLREEAIRYAQQWVAIAPQDILRLFIQGSIHWMLGRHENAIEDMMAVIQRTQDTNPKRADIAKNNYIYYVADCQLFRHFVRKEWLEQAWQFVKDLSDTLDVQGHESDTVGIFKILFSETLEDIDEGRRLIRKARDLRKNTKDEQIYQGFYRLHEYVALNRMLRISQAS